MFELMKFTIRSSYPQSCCQTAVIVDASNLARRYAAENDSPSFNKIWKDILGSQKIKGQINVRKAVGSWADPRLNVLRKDLQKHRFTLEFATKSTEDGTKDAAANDVASILSILTGTLPHITHIVIITGDSIAGAVVDYLRNKKKCVIGCCFDRPSTVSFKNQLNHFIAVKEPCSPATPSARRASYQRRDVGIKDRHRSFKDPLKRVANRDDDGDDHRDAKRFKGR